MGHWNIPPSNTKTYFKRDTGKYRKALICLVSIAIPYYESEEELGYYLDFEECKASAITSLREEIALKEAELAQLLMLTEEEVNDAR